jgi:hypothetical protein
MFAKGMWSCVTLLLVFFACVDINVAKTGTRQRRGSCVYNQYTNGCSTPTGYEPYRKEFTPACNEHDVCYCCVSNVYDQRTVNVIILGKLGIPFIAQGPEIQSWVSLTLG